MSTRVEITAYDSELISVAIFTLNPWEAHVARTLTLPPHPLPYSFSLLRFLPSSSLQLPSATHLRILAGDLSFPLVVSLHLHYLSPTRCLSFPLTLSFIFPHSLLAALVHMSPPHNPPPSLSLSPHVIPIPVFLPYTSASSLTWAGLSASAPATILVVLLPPSLLLPCHSPPPIYSRLQPLYLLPLSCKTKFHLQVVPQQPLQHIMLLLLLAIVNNSYLDEKFTHSPLLSCMGNVHKCSMKIRAKMI